MITIRQGELTKSEQDFQVVFNLLETESVTKARKDELRIRVGDGNYFFIIECSEHGAIGVAEIRCEAIDDYTLVSLIIAWRHRKKGHGTQLLNYIESHISSIDVAKNNIKLKCIAGNNSFMFYHNRGYKSDGCRMVKVLGSKYLCSK